MLSLVLKITHQKIRPFSISCKRNLISVLELKIYLLHGEKSVHMTQWLFSSFKIQNIVNLLSLFLPLSLSPSLFPSWIQTFSFCSEHYFISSLQKYLCGIKIRKSFNFITLEVFHFSGAEKVASGLRATEGVNTGLGQASVKLFFWLCSGFPLEGISLRLSNKTLYKEQTFYFAPHWFQELKTFSQALSGGTERRVLEPLFSHRSSNLKRLGRWS